MSRDILQYITILVYIPIYPHQTTKEKKKIDCFHCLLYCFTNTLGARFGRWSGLTKYVEDKIVFLGIFDRDK